ncbi:MAG: PKD domain-containing protein [Archaeoglobaceae archaeon]
MRSILAILIIFFALNAALALEISVRDSICAGEIVEIYANKDAFLILRLNDGYPVFGEVNSTSSLKLKTYVTGKLKIEAISGEERTEKIVEIKSCPYAPTPIPENYLPHGSFEKIVDGKTFTIDYRTALGALEKASKLKGFSYRLKITEWGLFVDCIENICSGYAGEGSGWMYWVNYPEKPMPGVSADKYKILAGDNVIWFFSRRMSETPDSATHKVDIYVDKDYRIYASLKLALNMPPVAKFSFSPLQPRAGELVKFYSESFDPDGYIERCIWDFGDGNVANECNVTHSYEKPGNYSVSLTVFDSHGLSDTKTRLVVVLPVLKEEVFERIVTIKGTLELECKVKGVPITKIVFFAEEKSVEVKIRKASPPDLLYATIYSCFEIKLNSSVIADLYFRLPRSWDPSFYRYENEWLKLEHEIVEEGEEFVVYKVSVEKFSVFAIAKDWEDFPIPKDEKRIQKALNYLRSLQRSSGGFANLGEEESIAKTSWAIMAIVAAGEDPRTWTKGNKSPLDYIRERISDEIAKMGTADYARTILALYSAKEDPREFAGMDLVSKLKQRVKENGQIGDYVYTTIWGILALSAVGEDVDKSVEWLKASQNPDGGFPWTVGEQSDFDDTAAAIQALIYAGEPMDSEVIKKALEYLKTGQNEDGGMRYFGNASSNAASDSWTIQALVSANLNPREWKKNEISVVDHLLSLQSEEGYFKYTTYVTDNPGYMTASAIMALLGKPFPIRPLKEVVPAKTEENVTLVDTLAETPAEIKTPEIVQIKTPVEEKKETIRTSGFEVSLAILALIVVLIARKRS